MDSKRFSELSKALASGQSRRKVAKGLAAGLLGGVLGWTGRFDADAATKRQPGESCRTDAECIDGADCIRNERTRRSICTCVDPDCGKVQEGGLCKSTSECISDAECTNAGSARPRCRCVDESCRNNCLTLCLSSQNGYAALIPTNNTNTNNTGTTSGPTIPTNNTNTNNTNTNNTPSTTQRPTIPTNNTPEECDEICTLECIVKC